MQRLHKKDQILENKNVTIYGKIIQFTEKSVQNKKKLSFNVAPIRFRKRGQREK